MYTAEQKIQEALVRELPVKYVRETKCFAFFQVPEVFSESDRMATVKVHKLHSVYQPLVEASVR